MKENDQDELLDNFAKGKLNAEELAGFNKEMENDADFRKKAESHVEFVNALKLYARRTGLIDTLQSVVLERPAEVQPKVIALNQNTTVRWRKIWPMAAVAASVALFSILGTMYLTQSLETKQTAYYKELRRNVEQIKKSQNRIMADIAVTKEKEKPLPGRYAGTGFLVSANGYVITSYHVVKGADSVYIENGTFGRLKASVVYNNAANDISVLRIENDGLKLMKSLPFVVQSTESSLGEDVFTLGFPREDIVFGEGSISATSGYEQNPNAYQVSVPVNPGNSGGPLFNAKGDLVGIISGKQTETSSAAFAIKSSVMLEALAEMPVDTLYQPMTLSKQNALRHLPKVEQVKKWQEYVFMVRVYNNQ